MSNKLMPKVFGWMFLGLLLTFFTGYYVAAHPFTAGKILNAPMYIVFAIIEFALVIFLSTRITKMSSTSAKICFLVYSIVSGLTFSSIFLYYEISSIIYVFLISAVIFGLFALIGNFTNMDLTKVGNYLIIGLFGALLCGIVNLFIKSSGFDLLISIVFVLIFVGLTAYDVQKIKNLGNSGQIPEDNLAIYGALELYLDFINIFLELLKIFGKRDD